MEFETDRGRWVGNFQPGASGLRFAGRHPNKRDAVVIADGDLWVVSSHEIAERLLPGLSAVFEVETPTGWIFDRQGLAFARLSLEGVLWHTRRISWDGFDNISVDATSLTGMAWSPVDEEWYPFAVDLQTGRARGGSYAEVDVEGWERLRSR